MQSAFSWNFLKNKKSSIHKVKSLMNTRYGRRDRIWTCGHLTPSQVRYQTAPLPADNKWTYFAYLIVYCIEDIKSSIKNQKMIIPTVPYKHRFRKLPSSYNIFIRDFLSQDFSLIPWLLRSLVSTIIFLKFSHCPTLLLS